jgi:hypothetical protein
MPAICHKPYGRIVADFLELLDQLPPNGVPASVATPFLSKQYCTQPGFATTDLHELSKSRKNRGTFRLSPVFPTAP